MENLFRRTKQPDLIGDAERDAAALAAWVEAPDPGDVPANMPGGLPLQPWARELFQIGRGSWRGRV